jgi:transcriptional regulator with XRE-family HTH domain
MPTSVDKTATSQGWVPNLESFGARLALIRQHKGWNIAEAERACGVGRGSWALWEQGRVPSRYITVCMQIAGATGVDLDWLVYGPDRARSRVTAGYPSRDPLATRVVRPTGPVRHGDARRKPADRLTAVRFADTPATSTRTRQTAPLPA